jgi:VWFA-related protein
MEMFRTGLRPVAGALLFLLPAAVCSQTSSPPSQSGRVYESQSVLRATTRLVIVDVVADNGRGTPITDLKAEDFIVLEDGQPQRVIDFSFRRPSTIAQAPRQLPPNVVSNAPRYSAASSLNIILLDAINTDFSNRAYAQDMLIKYLESGPVIQPTAAFALEGKLTLLQDFTTDAKKLAEVIAHFNPQGPSHIPDVYAAASPFSRRGSFQPSGQGRQVTFNAMRFLAHALAGYPGRKNLIWLSEGFPLNLFPETLMADGTMVIEDYTPEVEKIADELMEAQVALYPIDAAGVSINDRFPARTAMVSMAERTGGKTFFNRNDLDMGVRTSIDDGSTYYTLEYYPESKKWDGKFRKIEVKVNRPGVRLQYRRGYYALGPNLTGAENDNEVSRNFSQALVLDAPVSTGVLFQAGIMTPTDKTQNKYVVNFAIDPHTLVFERKDDGLMHAAVSCVVWAYHGKGDPIRSEGGLVKADLKPEVYEQVMKSYFPCKRPIELSRGDYTLRLGVIDRGTNLIGTTSLKIAVP